MSDSSFAAARRVRARWGLGFVSAELNRRVRQRRESGHFRGKGLRFPAGFTIGTHRRRQDKRSLFEIGACHARRSSQNEAELRRLEFGGFHQ